jgi:hypothetical protein
MPLCSHLLCVTFTERGNVRSEVAPTRNSPTLAARRAHRRVRLPTPQLPRQTPSRAVNPILQPSPKVPRLTALPQPTHLPSAQMPTSSKFKHAPALRRLLRHCPHSMSPYLGVLLRHRSDQLSLRIEPRSPVVRLISTSCCRRQSNQSSRERQAACCN